MSQALELGLLLIVFTTVLQEINPVWGHGRLMDPPARNSMWRFGFRNPVNYNDNELYCGGYSVQWEQNGGKCGVCGDAYNRKRDHEAGGRYARGIISRRYTVGQEISIEIDLTANHGGRFEVFVCPNNNPKYEATQECFDRYPLFIAGSRDVRYAIPSSTRKKAVLRYRVRLPPYLTCNQCVLQWTYYTGNMWGTCPNGTEAVGCGRPETFRNCADISIGTITSGLPPFFLPGFVAVPYYGDPSPFYASFRLGLPGLDSVAVSDIFSKNDNPFQLSVTARSSNGVEVKVPLVITKQVCVPTERFRNQPGMNVWCQENCLRYPPNCPADVCYCPEECEAIGEIEGQDGADVYCQDKCIIWPSDCPADRCRCY